MLSVIKNIYNKKTKGSTLMELFTGTGKLRKFFLTTRDVVVKALRYKPAGRGFGSRFDIGIFQ